MKNNKITPEGTRDILFEECESRNKIQMQLRELFQNGNYREIITPSVEFYDVFDSNTYFPQESMYKLMDSKGRLMVMRPDCTIPIARLAATRLGNMNMPIRLFYGQNVYRNTPDLRGKSNEVFQMGVELIGESGIDADLEIIKLAHKTLRNTKHRIEIGHIGFFKVIIESLNTDKNIKEQIRSYIEGKNYAALNHILEDFHCTAAKALRELPRLFGTEEVFDRARSLFCENGADVILDYLQTLYKSFSKEDEVIIDLGLVNQAEYYTGMIFRGYVEGIGEAVLSGGRYDNLVEDFGVSLAGAGFGVNIDMLVALNHRKTEENRKLRIALTKGRLEKDVVALLEKAGFDCSLLLNKGRKLVLNIPQSNIEVVLAKAADVITYIEHGVCDIGIVGKDTILEMGSTCYEILDLGFGKCRFALAAPKGIDFFEGYQTKRIATKYPKVAHSYFESKHMDVDIVKIEGSVELAPLIGLADGIVDIVETGKTLIENGLEVVEDIAKISARVIVNIASLKLRKQEIEEMILKIENVLN